MIAESAMASEALAVAQQEEVAPAGKSTVVGVVDDPNSKRQFQLEVTVTKLK